MIVDVSCVGEFFWAYLKKQEKIYIKKTICNTVRYTLTKIGTILLDHRSDQFSKHSNCSGDILTYLKVLK